ncbi:EAL domain-containing protein [Microvirga sp. W0021]|uniref:EAL domain-containing protein n=1 Tax=Hohaiivirga grylli TaxID=3133970 RepID=A0ABV0BJ78_9HYPH
MKSAVAHRAFASLKEAIADNEIRPVFQPVIRLADEQVVGFEVLARWSSSKFGDISPAEFIPYAEQNNMLDDLTSNLIRRASKIAVTWPGEFFLAFNIAPTQFRDHNLRKLVLNALETAQFPQDRVVIEMTEESQVYNKVKALEVMKNLVDDGLSFSLDDFGSGYGNIMRLRSYPFKYVKIDISLVEKITTNKDDEAVVASIIELAHYWGYEVIAEGIERKEQAALLKKLNCPMGQGWLFSRPLEEKDVITYIKNNT